jgi:drug/metabolite transporter (DMT)-like permease
VIDSLLILLPGLIWGASFLFIAEGLDAVSPSGVAFARILVGFLTLSLVPAVRRPILKSDRTRIAVLGVIWMAFPLSMFPFAEQHVSSALAGMLNGSVPLFVAAVASGIARQAPPRAVLVGLLVGFFGAILIALPGLTASVDPGGQMIGVLLILAALVSYGLPTPCPARCNSAMARCP